MNSGSRILCTLVILANITSAGCGDSLQSPARRVRDKLVKTGLWFDITMVDVGEPLLRKVYMVKTTNLNQIADIPIVNLYAASTNLTDISPLRRMPITCLLLTYTAVSDISPLAGKPIVFLDLRGTEVSDLTPLQGMPLRNLGIPEDKITNGIDIIRSMDTLELINRHPPERFWRLYDRKYGKKNMPVER